MNTYTETSVDNSKYDLSKSYPISYRFVIMKSFFPLFAVAASIFCALVFNIDVGLRTQSLTFASEESVVWLLQRALQIAILILTLVLICKLIYWELHRVCWYYALENGHLVVSRGVLLKQRGSFPLARISEVYLQRSALDLLFGLYSIHICTPSTESSEFARIEGLTSKVASELQEFLLNRVDEAQPREVRPVNSEREMLSPRTDLVRLGGNQSIPVTHDLMRQIPIPPALF